jgi:hypothetical protein
LDFEFGTLNFEFLHPMTIFTKNSNAKMLRTLIIDDEPNMRLILQGLAVRFLPPGERERLVLLFHELAS